MISINHGDCREVLKTCAEASILFDSCVTDPPYHLTSIVKRFGAENAAPAQFGKDGAYARASKGFMGQQWDGGDVAFQPETWKAVYDALKPGAFLLAFGGTRTYHRLACAIEDAGFEIRDTIMWHFGTGFPKSHSQPGGFGTALKPSTEIIAVARKPLIGTVKDNMTAYGTGCLNIDKCRIEGRERTAYGLENSQRTKGAVYGNPSASADFDSTKGRWPANLIHDGSDEVLELFPDNTSGSAARFFYCAKANKTDRAGSGHPTVKPLALIQYLIRLVTPPGGIVLDPFAGSGTLASAAHAEGFDAYLIEQSAEYIKDIKIRVKELF